MISKVGDSFRVRVKENDSIEDRGIVSLDNINAMILSIQGQLAEWNTIKENCEALGDEQDE